MICILYSFEWFHWKCRTHLAGVKWNFLENFFFFHAMHTVHLIFLHTKCHRWAQWRFLCSNNSQFECDTKKNGAITRACLQGHHLKLLFWPFWLTTPGTPGILNAMLGNICSFNNVTMWANFAFRSTVSRYILYVRWILSHISLHFQLFQALALALYTQAVCWPNAPFMLSMRQIRLKNQASWSY